MVEELRKTGIDIIGDLAWGTHFCLFYQSKEDLAEILVPYFKAGLESNEYCVWVTSETISKEEAEKALVVAVPDFRRYVKNGQIEIIPHTQWYAKHGACDLQSVLDAWLDKLYKAVSMGYDGLRITGDTAWLEKRAWTSFVAYEQEVNKAISRQQMIAVCTYCLDKCGASEVVEVANAHQFAAIQWQGKWAIVQDAKHKWTEHTLRALNEDLEAKVGQLTLSNRALQDFAHVVAHDLKVPLRAIATLARRISTVYADRLGEDGKVQIDLLLSKVDRIHSLIDGVLECGRVGRVKAKLVPTDLNALLREVIDMVAPPQNIAITVEGELPVVACEPTHVIQVFQNLISNAVRYIDKPKGRIGIGCVEENSSWKFSVTDNGPGIEKKYLKRIFELFQTLSCHNEPKGTGIGLWAVKRIVQMYGGEVWVESEVDAGSTFFFTWPITDSVLEDSKAVLSSGL